MNQGKDVKPNNLSNRDLKPRKIHYDQDLSCVNKIYFVLMMFHKMFKNPEYFKHFMRHLPVKF